MSGDLHDNTCIDAVIGIRKNNIAVLVDRRLNVRCPKNSGYRDEQGVVGEMQTNTRANER